jgi:ABC-2 type transport system permease protein
VSTASIAAGYERVPARAVSARATLATARRVLTQLRNDHRTVALLVVAPCLLITLFKYVFQNTPGIFDRVGLPMLGIFPMVTMFLVTVIAMVRERTTGTLERLLTTPLGKLDLLLGYALGFGSAALVQSAIVSALALGPLGLKVQAGVGVVLVVAVVNALLGMALGLFLSAFAQTEFQAVQFLPAIVFPQILLCGLIVPRDQMAPVLEAVSVVLPLTWAYDALHLTATLGETGGAVVRDAAVVAGCSLLALAAGAATLRRRTP